MARDDGRRGNDRGHDRSYDRGYERGYGNDRYARDDYRRDRDRDSRRGKGHGRGYGKGHGKGHRDHVVYVSRPPVVVHHNRGHRGPPPWARGRHYQYAGYAPTYVVQDYRHYGLRHPPRGHHWRRSDAGEFLLVAVATGIIADIFLGR
ncbi:RcnB family protein [Luteimonas sp. MC1782]|nr:RcnB family protein [Luteimonas sp. MC1782]